MAVTIQLRRDTHAALNTANPNIAPGEIVIDTTNNRAVVNSTSSTLAYNTAIAAGQFLTLDDSNGRTLGGGANEVQLSVKGASTQGDPIFQVTDNGGTNKIFSVTDNDTTICTIENHGDTADKVVQIIGQTGQKADGSGGSLLEVITESGDSTGLFVDNEGNVSILPADGEGEQAALLVKGSSAGDADAKIFEVQDEGGNQEFLVKDGEVTVPGSNILNVDGTLKVDDITEHTADHGVAIAKPISVTGNITGSSNLVIPNQPCQTRITQTSSVASYDLVGNSDATAINFTQVTQLAVSITPAVAGSKILIEVSCQGGDQSDSPLNRPEYLCGTLFRQVGSGSATDISAANTTGFVNALFAGTGNRHNTRGSITHHSCIVGQHLDTPSYTLGQQLTYTLGLASHEDQASGDNVGVAFRLNKAIDTVGHDVHFVSLIKATEIPQ